MMDWTDRDCRYYLRLLSPHARLYTEMVVAQAAIRGDRERLLGFDQKEHPLALQLGGSDPGLLAQASKIGQDFGYDEINLNCGCPSDRVQSGRFGACLMLEPERVAECVHAMQHATANAIPITIKCRLGVDEVDDFASFLHFVDILAQAGTQVFIVHARKAWLKGLSPRENREVPPLWYDRVYRLKQMRPGLTVVLNGGLDNFASARQALSADDGTRLDGIMLGRAAYHQSWVLAELEMALFGTALPARADVVTELERYVQSRVSKHRSLRQMGRHFLGFFHGEPGTKLWRQELARGQSPLQAWRAVHQITANKKDHLHAEV
jgi:tRNA-dihydrouridine synthase A